MKTPPPQPPCKSLKIWQPGNAQGAGNLGKRPRCSCPWPSPEARGSSGRVCVANLCRSSSFKTPRKPARGGSYFAFSGRPKWKKGRNQTPLASWHQECPGDLLTVSSLEVISLLRTSLHCIGLENACVPSGSVRVFACVREREHLCV